MSKPILPRIPYDVFQSVNEFVILIPLAWVDKNSIDIRIKDYKLIISGDRKRPKLKKDCSPIKEDCYRWKLKQEVDLPPQVHFDKIHSKLNTENVLEIIVPKSIIPDKVRLEYE